jgi:hypothetical protein
LSDSEARAALKNKKYLDDTRSSKTELIHSTDIHQIYAALGSQDTGATHAKILGRTGLTEKTVESGLQTLISSKLITQTDGRYYAASQQIDTPGLDATSGVADLVADVTRNIHKDRERLLKNTRNLLVYSTFSISATKADIKKQDQGSNFRNPG